MMKKTFITVLAFAFAMGIFAQEQTDSLLVQSDSTDLKGVHPVDLEENTQGVVPEYSYFSLGLELGFNSFDGDFRSEMKHPVWVPSAGFTFEYHLTPIWTLGAEYVFDWYKVTGKGGDVSADVLLDGMMHRVQGYLSFDLMAVCFPYLEKRVFEWEFLVGGGYAWSKNKVFYPDQYRQITASADPMSADKYKGSPFLLGGTEFIFNINRTISLGIKGTYSYFMSDDIDGRGVGPIGYKGTVTADMLRTSVASKNNDGIFDVSLHLRVKLCGVKKTHVRNIYSIPRTVVLTAEPVDHGKDTVVVYHQDTLLVESHDTLVVNHVDTVRLLPAPIVTNAVQSVSTDEHYYIYFANDRSDFNNDALIRIQQVASRLQMDSTLCAEIIGMCDNTGDVDYNNTLGLTRAHNVYDELVQEHRIDANRLTYRGKGIIYGGRSKGSYAPNRRCDVRIISSSEFEAVKKANEEQNAQQEKAVQEVQPEGDVITVEEGMTLGSIAQEHYGNAYCWVYIYEANANVLKTPHHLATGSRLVLPKLSEEQLHVTKSDAEAHYNQTH